MFHLPLEMKMVKFRFCCAPNARFCFKLFALVIHRTGTFANVSSLILEKR